VSSKAVREKLRHTLLGVALCVALQSVASVLGSALSVLEGGDRGQGHAI
jgi:hypothetical protein